MSFYAWKLVKFMWIKIKTHFKNNLINWLSTLSMSYSHKLSWIIVTHKKALHIVIYFFQTSTCGWWTMCAWRRGAGRGACASVSRTTATRRHTARGRSSSICSAWWRCPLLWLHPIENVNLIPAMWNYIFRVVSDIFYKVYSTLNNDKKFLWIGHYCVLVFPLHHEFT